MKLTKVFEGYRIQSWLSTENSPPITANGKVSKQLFLNSSSSYSLDGKKRTGPNPNPNPKAEKSIEDLNLILDAVERM